MPEELRIALRGRLDEVPRANAALSDFAEAQGLPVTIRRRLNVVLDELLTNIVVHGLAGREDGEALVHVLRDGDRIVLTLSDNGPPFDPFARAAPDTTLSVTDRPIGGLGVHLVAHLVDDARYEYRDGRNVVVLTKAIA